MKAELNCERERTKKKMLKRTTTILSKRSSSISSSPRPEDRKPTVEEFDAAQRLAKAEAEREVERARNAQLEARLQCTEEEARRYP